MANSSEDGPQEEGKDEDNEETEEGESSSASISPIKQKDKDLEQKHDKKHTDSVPSTDGKGNHQDSKYHTAHSIEHYKQNIKMPTKEALIAEMKIEFIKHEINNTHNLEDFKQLKHKIDLQIISRKINDSFIHAKI